MSEPPKYGKCEWDEKDLKIAEKGMCVAGTPGDRAVRASARGEARPGRVAR